jgi:hypothetical protein
MDNFFNYISKPLLPEDVDVWFRVNNIISEKLELYSDFTHSLNILIIETYLGESESKETNIVLTEDDDKHHFEWCWDKVITNFNQENIKFNKRGEHYDYFDSFFNETFYHQKDVKIKSSIGYFFTDLFNLEKVFTKSDLDMITTIYKLLDKQMEH